MVSGKNGQGKSKCDLSAFIGLTGDIESVARNVSGQIIQDIKENVRVVDLIVPLLLASAPLVSYLLICHMSSSIQDSFTLYRASPTLATLYTTHFIHLDYGHFLRNLKSYILVAVVIYFLILLSGKRRELYAALFVIFLIIPFLISLSDVSCSPFGTGRGFSGVNSALYAFLPIPLFYVVGRWIIDGVEVYDSMLVFLVIAGISMYRLGESWVFVVETILLIILYLVLRFYLLGAKDYRFKIVGSIKCKVYQCFSLIFILFGVYRFFRYPFLFIPLEVSSNGISIGIVPHLVGFILGFSIPYFGILLGRSVIAYLERDEVGIES